MSRREEIRNNQRFLRGQIKDGLWDDIDWLLSELDKRDEEIRKLRSKFEIINSSPCWEDREPSPCLPDVNRCACWVARAALAESSQEGEGEK